MFRNESGSCRLRGAPELVETAPCQRVLEIAAGAPQARVRPHPVDRGVQRRRIRAEALEGQPGRCGERRQERVRIVQRERRETRCERVRAGQCDRLARRERLVAEDAGHQVRERGEIRLSERSEHGDRREPIAIERIHEPLHGLDAHGRSARGQEIHGHQQRAPHGVAIRRRALPDQAVADEEVLEARTGDRIDELALLAPAPTETQYTGRPAASARSSV